MKKILFYSRSGQKKLYPLISNNILDFESIHMVQNDEEYKIVSSICPQAQIYNLTEFISANWDNTLVQAEVSLSEIESRYQIDSIWKLFYTDRFLTKYNYSEAVKLIKLHYLFIKSILVESHPSYFINEEVAIFSSFLFLKVCKAHNCKYIGFSVPRNFTNEKFLFTYDEYTHYHELDYYYKSDKLSKKEINEAKRIIDNVKEEKIKPEYMRTQGQKPRFKIYFFWAIFRAISNIKWKKVDKYDYTKTRKSVSAIKELVFFYRYLRQRKYYQQPIENQKYILFPLHFQPEASTLVKATDFENQINTLEIIAKNMPGEYVLYVKEHYARLGHRSMDFYRKIKTFPNIRLVDPFIDSHELIVNSDGVIVLTSTVGWEALIYNKPVFILGNVFYESFKYSIKVDNIFCLSKLIKNTIKEYKGKQKEFQEDFVRYYASYLKAMHDGHYILSPIVSDENVQKLSKALLNEISILEQTNNN